jgi:hypothetical protein
VRRGLFNPRITSLTTALDTFKSELVSINGDLTNEQQQHLSTKNILEETKKQIDTFKAENQRLLDLKSKNETGIFMCFED